MGVPQMMDYDYGLWMDYDYGLWLWIMNGLWTNGKNDGTNDGLWWNEWIMMDYERMVNEWIMDPQVDPMAIQLVDCDHCDHICWVRFSEVWPSRIASVAIRCGQQGPWPWKIGQHYHWTSHDKSQLAKLIDLRSGYGSIPMKIPFLMGWTSILTQLFWCEQKRGTKLVLTPSEWFAKDPVQVGQRLRLLSSAFGLLKAGRLKHRIHHDWMMGKF
jgi:hypothetical protein